MTLEIGSNVRVRVPAAPEKRKKTTNFVQFRATICCEKEEDDTIEIIPYPRYRNLGVRYASSPRDAEEETTSVHVDLLSSLEDFEAKDHSETDPLQLKKYGNELFRLRDYAAAEELYMHGLRSMDARDRASCEQGTTVYVRRNRTITSATVDKMDGVEKWIVRVAGDPSNIVVRDKDLLAVKPRLSSRVELKRALHLNTARCCLHNDDPQAALWHANIAYELSLDQSSPENSRTVRTLCLRSRAHLACSLPRHAKKDCVRAAMLAAESSDVDVASTRHTSASIVDIQEISRRSPSKHVRKLAKDIVTNMKSRARTSKTLAKEFSTWLGQTVRTSGVNEKSPAR